MDMNLQTKLLRFIQTGSYERVGEGRTRQADIRFVAATNRDPMQAVNEGRLREDLFYRLFVVPLEMPPLRARGEDILLLARKFMADIAQNEKMPPKTLSPQAEARLLGYNWPGNVRQLQNVIHNAMIMNQEPVLTVEMLPLITAATEKSQAEAASLPPETDAGIIKLADMERLYVERAIRLCAGNIQLAARKLGINASTIYRKKEAWDAGPGVSVAE
jgi:two-component system repressor protein LuxO